MSGYLALLLAFLIAFDTFLMVSIRSEKVTLFSSFLSGVGMGLYLLPSASTGRGQDDRAR